MKLYILINTIESFAQV